MPKATRIATWAAPEGRHRSHVAFSQAAILIQLFLLICKKKLNFSARQYEMRARNVLTDQLTEHQDFLPFFTEVVSSCDMLFFKIASSQLAILQKFYTCSCFLGTQIASQLLSGNRHDFRKIEYLVGTTTPRFLSFCKNGNTNSQLHGRPQRAAIDPMQPLARPRYIYFLFSGKIFLIQKHLAISNGHVVWRVKILAGDSRYFVSEII